MQWDHVKQARENDAIDMTGAVPLHSGAPLRNERLVRLQAPAPRTPPPVGLPGGTVLALARLAAQGGHCLPCPAGNSPYRSWLAPAQVCTSLLTRASAWWQPEGSRAHRFLGRICFLSCMHFILLLTRVPSSHALRSPRGGDLLSVELCLGPMRCGTHSIASVSLRAPRRLLASNHQFAPRVT